MDKYDNLYLQHEGAALELSQEDADRLEGLDMIFWCPDCNQWHVTDEYEWMDIYEALGLEVEE